MKRTLTIIAGILLVISIPVFLYWLGTRPVPALDGNEYCPGLEKSVTVRYDNHAIPYIEANTDFDSYEAQGYVTARERMFQMDMLRRAALGQLSQIYGIDTLQSDRLMRTLGIAKLAEEEWTNLTPLAREVLEAYTKGVNAYLANDANKQSIEFALLGYRPSLWRPQESLAVMKYLAYKNDESWRLDDFRQRVQNKVGERLAARLFRDDLAAYGLPASASVPPQQTDKAESKKTNSANSKTAPHNPKPKTAQTAPAAPDQVAPTDEAAGLTPQAPATAPPAAPATAPAAPAGDEETPPVPIKGSLPQTPSNTDRLLDNLATLGNQVHKSDAGQPLWGSTAWAVPAGMSKSHGALLACDKDSSFTVPTQWFLCSLNGPRLHVAGATIPGVPGIMLGRNEAISWGGAMLKADVQDIFLEEFKSQFDTTYKLPANSWAEAELRTEIIPVRFGNPVEHKIFTTRHGPVLLRVNQAAISLSWTGSDTKHPAFNALLQINKAGGIDEIKEALKDYKDPAEIFLFADRAGNIGYQMAGAIPLRVGGGQGTMLNTGWENKGAWQSMISPEKLPGRIIARSSDKSVPMLPIVAANQCPSFTTPALPAADQSLMIGHQWQPPYRANRALSFIKETAKNSALSLIEMNQLQGDEFSQLSPLVSKTLQDAALATQYADRNGVSAISALLKWNGQLKGTGTQATVYEAFLQTMMRRCLEPSLGKGLALEYMQRWPLWLTQAEYIMRYKPLDILPPEERTYNTFFLTTLAQSMKSLHIAFAEQSPVMWVWNKAHQALFMDWASSSGAWFSRFTRIGPVGVGGANETLNSCEVKPDQNGLSYWCTTGPTERMIVDMADSDKFYQSIATGQSEHLFSHYRADQMPTWLKVDLLPIAFSPTQIVRQSQHRLVLVNEFGTR